MKKWFSTFINLFFPSMSAYRTYDKDIIEYIENNTLIEMNCKRILYLSPILILLPIIGIKGLYGKVLFAFILVVTVAALLSAFTIFVSIKISKATRSAGNGILKNKRYYELLYEVYWTCWMIGMLIIGFSKLNVSMIGIDLSIPVENFENMENVKIDSSGGSYLYLTQLCMAFLPLFTPKKMKRIGIATGIWAILLTVNLLYYGRNIYILSAVIFIISNMMLVLLISFIIQQLNLTTNVMIAYVRLVGFLDQLTNVYNRRGYQFRMNEMSAETIDAGIIMLDIDFFKKYNDTFGHIKGDEILKTIAESMRNTLDYENNIIVRFGGEEFAIFCMNHDVEHTIATAQKIKEAISELKIPSADTSISEYLTVSMGVHQTTIRKDDALDEIIAISDQALYQAKEQGRNRIVCL